MDGINMPRIFIVLCILFLVTACAPASNSAPEPAPATDEVIVPDAATATETQVPSPTFTVTPIPPTETPTATPTETPLPTVDSLKAKVIAEKIVCRYGPGANYLYLIAFNQSTPVRLIGRAAGNDWVLVENDPQDCWVKSEFLESQEGDFQTLRSVYPEEYKIPVSPYYGPTTVLTATREGDEVTVTWMEIIVSPGKYEDENMFPYIVEVWVCQDGEIVFNTLGSRLPFITFTDQPGCTEPSRGRVYIQEKHGYAGPAEIPWP